MAKATAGKTYAQIVNGRCHWIFTQSDLPEYNENHIQVVEVIGAPPAQGDTWLGGSSFTPYVPPPKTQAEINAEADRMIAKHAQAALPTLLEVMVKLASGADKTALKAYDDAIKAEKAKKA